MAFLIGCGAAARGVEGSSSVFIRHDTDHTTVISPRVGAKAQVGEQITVEASETVDAWTGASVDVVTAATSTIRERRYETNFALALTHDAWTFGASYRNSLEPDYRSNGGALRLARDLAQKNTSLALTFFGSADTVGRAGDPRFARPQSSLGARLTLTQIIGPHTFGSLHWETTQIEGYQASPYRFVGLGGDGVCAQTAIYCVPEQVPSDRTRHAVVAYLRHALGRRWSAGIGYRFYFDSWGLRSHTLEPDIAWLVTPRDSVSFGLRTYSQREADFYRARYTVAPPTGLLTRDRKLSAMRNQAATISYWRSLPAATAARWQVGLRSNVERLNYLDFVGLNQVWVWDATIMVSVGLP